MIEETKVIFIANDELDEQYKNKYKSRRELPNILLTDLETEQCLPPSSSNPM
jgi:hypothetical protein